MLEQLWLNLMYPKILPSKKGAHWSDIGFQGDDPMTDFRGMGILGLMNLLFFSDYNKQDAQSIIYYTHEPTQWYPFAIVGINLTSMAYYLLINGDLKYILYHNYNYFLSDIHTFHQFYCSLFILFHKYWCLQKPKDIMEFSRIIEEYKSIIKWKLWNRDIEDLLS